MTRFIMTLDDAVNLVLFAFEHGRAGEIFVQESPSATIGTLSEAVKALMNVPTHQVTTIGTRHGEKLFEVLLSREEMVAAEDLGNYYRVSPDLRDLNYGKFMEQGEHKISQTEDYNSQNTTRLDVEGMKAVLIKLRFMQAFIRGEQVVVEE
jgi:UDP-glucose 4-epimerase